MLALATLQHTVNAFLKLIFDKHPLVVLQSILVFASALIAILRIGNNDLMHCEKYFRMIRETEEKGIKSAQCKIFPKNFPYVFASALIAILRIGNNDLIHCEKYFRMISVKEQLQKPD